MRITLALLISLIAGTAAQAGGKAFTDNSGYKDAYNDPLVFGMTRAEVEQVVGAPLVYLSGARGSERFLVERRTAGAFYQYWADTRVVLQFRRGHLTGWRRDWQARPYWF